MSDNSKQNRKVNELLEFARYVYFVGSDDFNDLLEHAATMILELSNNLIWMEHFISDTFYFKQNPSFPDGFFDEFDDIEIPDFKRFVNKLVYVAIDVIEKHTPGFHEKYQDFIKNPDCRYLLYTPDGNFDLRYREIFDSKNGEFVHLNVESYVKKAVMSLMYANRVKNINKLPAE